MNQFGRVARPQDRKFSTAVYLVYCWDRNTFIKQHDI